MHNVSKQPVTNLNDVHGVEEFTPIETHIAGYFKDLLAFQKYNT